MRAPRRRPGVVRVHACVESGMRSRRAGMARRGCGGGWGDRSGGRRGAIARRCGRSRVLRRHQGVDLHSDCPPGRARARPIECLAGHGRAL